MFLLKFGFASMILISSLYGLNISYTKSTILEVTPQEVKHFSIILKKRGIKINQVQAKKAILENRVLADDYLMQFDISEDIANEFKLMLEEKLREMRIKEAKNAVNISDDILLSYYKDNKDNYYKTSEIEFNVYTFSTFNKALEFYQKNDLSKNKTIVSDNNITSTNEKMSINQLHPELLNLLKDETSFGYLVPPEKFFKNYIILEVVNIEKGHIELYENVKKAVRRDLEKKITKDITKKLLDKFNIEKNSEI
ncbi:MAG: hypothetical protein U9P71_06300 [Campylobacterota bacterium]|nr:hypothetical protein [Campylobacterota bacterium]